MERNDEYWKYHGTPNCKCVVCGKEMYVKPNRLKRVKNGCTCSKVCDTKRRRGWNSGEKNPQYGVRGEQNASFKSIKKVNSAGYVTVYKPEHPFCNGAYRVLEHRLIVEENADLYEPRFFIEIGGKKYLRKEFQVHHKNEIKNDNRVENLQVVTKSEHRKLHNTQKELIKRRNGKIYAFIKKGESIPIKIKLYGDGRVPVRKTAGSACYDCFANEEVVIPKGERRKVGLGFGLDMPYMFEAIIRPRSGLSLKGIDSCIGTIDEDFKSEISAILANNSGEDFEVKKGDRICQLAIRKYERFCFLVTDELSETERGEGGWGHTGV